MKRFTKLLLTAMLLVAGVGSVNAEKSYASLSSSNWWAQADWNAGTNTMSWVSSWELPSGGNGTWRFIETGFANCDITSYTKFHATLSKFSDNVDHIWLRIKQGDNNYADAKLVAGENNIDLVVLAAANPGVNFANITDITLWGAREALEGKTIGSGENTASVVITDVYMEKPDPEYVVTYVVKDTNGSTIFTSAPQGTTLGAHITTLPNEFKRGFCEYTSDGVTIEDKETTVEFTATWNNCPITFSADYASIVWKNLYLNRSQQSQQWYLNNDPTPCLVGNPSDNDCIADSYQWGFVGNPYRYKIYNKAAGSSNTLNQSAVMAEGETIWTSVAKNGEGILFGRASDGQFLNQYGGPNSTSLGFWYDPTDEGSTFFVADVPEPSLIIGEAGWATFGNLDKSANLDGATNVYAAKYADGKVTLTTIESGNVPAGKGVIVEGSGEIVLTFGVEADEVDSDLKVSNGSVTGDGSTIFVLANGTSGVGFYLLKSGDKVPAGKAYLTIPATSREFIAINGEATAIKSVETEKANGAVYNLAGQQVKSAQKGVFIIDGKKVIK